MIAASVASSWALVIVVVLAIGYIAWLWLELDRAEKLDDEWIEWHERRRGR